MALWATHATSDALLREAVLESYLIHVRGLNEFLLKGRDGRGTRVDDVVAEDYFDGRWSTVVPLLIQPELDDIHRRIAHLSTHRLARNTPGTRFNWAGQDPLDRWARTIHGGLKSFIDDLRNAHPDRATWFEPSITA